MKSHWAILPQYDLPILGFDISRIFGSKCAAKYSSSKYVERNLERGERGFHQQVEIIISMICRFEISPVLALEHF